MVTPGQKISLDQLQTLAALANAKGIPGGPYNFASPQNNPYASGHGTWTTELARMRANAYSRFRLFDWPQTPNLSDYEFQFPSHPDMIVSGPWFFKDNYAPELTPSITDDTRSDFGNFQAGYYRVTYERGALRYTTPVPGDLPEWRIQNPRATRGFKIEYGGGTIKAPGNNLPYETQASCENSNRGASVTFYHTGGPIKIYLDDLPYHDNQPGDPTPTFSLFHGIQTFSLNQSSIRGEIPTFKQNKYTYLGAGGSVRTVATLQDGIRQYFYPFGEGENYLFVEGSDTEVRPYKFLTRGIEGFGIGFKLNFELLFIAHKTFVADPTPTFTLTGADAASCTYEIIQQVSSGFGTDIYGRIRLAGAYFRNADFTFEVGIQPDTAVIGTIQMVQQFKATAGPFVRQIFNTRIYWENDFSTSAATIPVIHTAVASTITPPQIDQLKITRPDVDANDNWESGGKTYFGNQAHIEQRGNIKDAVWSLKTYPMGGSHFYQAKGFNDRGLNFECISASAATPAFPSVSRTCEFILPVYPVAKFGTGADPNFIIPYSPIPTLMYGAFIREFFARRWPVKMPDVDIWVQPTVKPPIVIKVGTVSSTGTFIEFQTFTIPEGESQIQEKVFWGACAKADDSQHLKLFYQSTEPLNIQCTVQAALNLQQLILNNLTPGIALAGAGSYDPLFTGTNNGISFYPGWPIRADHYNDAEAILNLISDP